MSKFFNLIEAENLLPDVERRLKEAIRAKAEIQGVDRHLNELRTRVQLLGGVEPNPLEFLEQGRAKAAWTGRLEQAVAAIQDMGCLIKDLDVGLVDFPALLDGNEVYLCWKLGEPRIEHWHRVDEGFGGRKRVGDEFGGRGPTKPN